MAPLEVFVNRSLASIDANPASIVLTSTQQEATIQSPPTKITWREDIKTAYIKQGAGPLEETPLEIGKPSILGPIQPIGDNVYWIPQSIIIRAR